jgi:hypothetical protein
MANSANYLLSKLLINMTILELSVRDLQKTLMLQIKLIKKEEGHPDRQDKIIPMKERLIENLQIHLADADPQLKRDQQLRNTLPTPEEFAEVSGDRLVMKRFVLQLVFGALGTYMGTLTDKKYERLQESLTTTNIMQKKLIEVVNNQDSLIQRIAKSLDYNNLFDYLVIQNQPTWRQPIKVLETELKQKSTESRMYFKSPNGED